MDKTSSKIKPIPILVILGPTASGKSKLAIKIAKQLNACIINADSRQIYKDFYIGTNSPSPSNLNEVPHYLYNFLHPSIQFSAAEYSSIASNTIINLYKNGNKIVLVGGAGLYIKALLEGLFYSPGQNKHFRNSLKNIALLMGTDFLYKQLKSIDPASANTIFKNDQFRIIRALEIFYLTGKTKSELIKYQNHKPIFSPLKIGLLPPKHILYKNIEKRTNKMIENGLIEEVKSLLQKFDSSSPAFNSIGYKEIIDFLNKKINIEEAIALINKNTKAYAKRQITWFKKDTTIIWLSPEQINFPELLNTINNFFLKN